MFHPVRVRVRVLVRVPNSVSVTTVVERPKPNQPFSLYTDWMPGVESNSLEILEAHTAQ